MDTHFISAEKLTIAKVEELISNKTKIALSDSAKEKINACRKYLDDKLADNKRLFYGINTGFGSLCNVRIEDQELEDLQYKLVVSTACGMGDEMPHEIIRLLLLFKIQSLSYGYSAIALNTIETLVDCYLTSCSLIVNF